MTEEKTTTTSKESTEDNKTDGKVREDGLNQKVVKATNDSKSAVDLKDAEDDKEEKISLEVEKDESGLEQLPEDIMKKLEKKKAENEQKHKKVKIRKKKKKVARKVPIGKAYIKSTYNNTIVTLTDMQGAVISWASAGVAGFKGPKKATPYAAQIITRIAVGKARQEFGLSEVSVFVRGVGTGRESAIRSLNNNGLIVTSIQDVTPKPHNGCRVRRPRRV
jgi:small subunit ribosomal protein S11